MSTGNVLAVFVLLALLCCPALAYPRIEQGQTVFLNETYDISGVTGWPDDDGDYWLQWCDGAEDCPLNRTGTYFLKLPNKGRLEGYASQFAYTIDPNIFGNKSGYWLQYSGLRERAGNIVAFYVEARYRNVTTTLQNGTVINQTLIYNPDITDAEKPEPFGYILPDMYVADYVLARGDDLTIETPDARSQVWIFGRVDAVYGFVSTGNKTVIPKALTENFEVGSYTVLVQRPGFNGDIDIRYYDKNLQCRNDWDIWTEELYNAPQVDLDIFTRVIYKTDDKYDIFRLEIQEPEITVASVDEKYIGNAKEVFRMDDVRGDVTAFIVKGYTNTVNGTKITFVLNPDKQTPRTLKDNTYSDEAICKSPGYMCQYQVAVPFYWEDVMPGMHTLYGTTEIGGRVYSDFFVSQMPADSFRPNATLKYVEDRNPFHENMTKVVVTEVVENKTTVVEERVIIEKEPFDYGRLTDNIIQTFGIPAIITVIAMILLAAIARWTLIAYGRKQE